MSDSGLGDVWLPVAIMFGVLLLAYLGMWRGWRRRAGRHDLPELVPAPPVADLPPTGWGPVASAPAAEPGCRCPRRAST